MSDWMEKLLEEIEEVYGADVMRTAEMTSGGRRPKG